MSIACGANHRAEHRTLNETVDLLVVGSGTGLASALAAHDRGLTALVVEKTSHVGGSTARSGGAFWIPANPALRAAGAVDSIDRATEYLRSVVGESAPEDRWRSFLTHGPATVDMLARTTPMRFSWARDYADYHAEHTGGTAAGRSCECRPFDAAVLGAERARLRPGVLDAPVPMPVTGADYRWMNLVARVPRKGVPRIAQRALQGIGGLLLGREYLAGGQALAAGLFAGVLRAGIPVWTDTPLVRLVIEGDRVTGAVVRRHDREVTVTARRGVVLATGGFDHDLALRHRHQSPSLEGWSLGSDGNTGDGIRIAQEAGADTALMDQAWWFPAVAPLPGASPQVLLAERSLPGSLMVDAAGRRFVNEAVDYMTFGQGVLARERAGDPVDAMWLVVDQSYRDSYVFAGTVFPASRSPAPGTQPASPTVRTRWTVSPAPPAYLLSRTPFAGSPCWRRPASTTTSTAAPAPTTATTAIPRSPPTPNLRPLRRGPLHAVRVVLSDLGTCGGIRTDGHARALRADGSPIDGLYAIGNTAANAFGTTYPGAGATIGQGLVFGHLAVLHAAQQ